MTSLVGLVQAVLSQEPQIPVQDGLAAEGGDERGHREEGAERQPHP